jgi:hypothetical protein
MIGSVGRCLDGLEDRGYVHVKGLRSLGTGSLHNPYLHYRQQVANTFDWVTHCVYLNSPIISIS